MYIYIYVYIYIHIFTLTSTTIHSFDDLPRCQRFVGVSFVQGEKDEMFPEGGESDLLEGWDDYGEPLNLSIYNSF